MSFRFRPGIILLIWLMALPGVAGARSNGLGERWHLGIEIGQSRLRPDTSATVFNVGDDSDTSFVFSLGYDLSAWLSLQGYAADLGRARIDQGGHRAGTISYTSTGLGVTGYLPLWGRQRPGAFNLGMRQGLALFGGAGIGILDTYTLLPHVQNQDYHLWTTAGLEFGGKRGLAVRLQWTGYDRDAANVGIGIVKRFGSVASSGLPLREASADDSSPALPVVSKSPVTPVSSPRAPVARRRGASKGFFQLAMPIVPIRRELGRFMADPRVDELLEPMALGLKRNPGLRVEADSYYLPASGATARKIGVVVDDVVRRLLSMGVRKNQVGIAAPKLTPPNTLLPANRIEFSIAPWQYRQR